jgi:hypothetical protein
LQSTAAKPSGDASFQLACQIVAMIAASRRYLVVLVVVIVFAALMLFDTTALVRLAVFCATGGCGVRPIWIALAIGGIALAALLSSWRPGVTTKGSTASKNRARRSTRRNAGARKKSNRSK